MPRLARKDSKSSFYHVMVQGINKEYIFDTDFNIKKYIELIVSKIYRSNIEILAYCIMNNHAHFLIYCEKIEDLSKFMQKLNTSYSRFYNKINKRVGYVFRDRYLSQDIFDKKQLYNCLNYIHNNPVKAEIVKNASEYKYSSYSKFFNKKNIITNRGIELLFGLQKDYKKQLIKISSMYSDTQFIDIKEKKKEINEFVTEVEKYYQKKINRIKEDKKELEFVLKKARKETDETIVNLAKLFEISKSSVGKYIKK